MTYNASFVGSKQAAHQMQVIPESHVGDRDAEMQIEGQETSEKMGCLPLSSHPTCNVGFTNPLRSLFLLAAIEFAFDFFWLHKISRKVQYLDNQPRQQIWLYGQREECRRCSVAGMIGWEKGRFFGFLSRTRSS